MARKASFAKGDRIPTVDEIVASRHAERSPEEELAAARGEHVTGQPGVPKHYRFDPEYAAKNRAQELMSMQVIHEYSPSTRFSFKPGSEEKTPWAYRWMHPAVRHRKGMAGYVPVTELDEAKALVEHNDLHEGEDGKIYMGNLFLAKIDKKTRESRTALAYQRSQRLMAAAQGGQLNPLTKAGVRDGQGVVGQEAGETTADIHNRTARRLGKKGVQVETSFEDDYPGQ